MNLDRIQRSIFLSDLNAMMLEKNISQKELGKRIGVRPSQLSLWLSGSKSMSIDRLILITNTIKEWGKPEDILCEPDFQYGEPQPSLGFLLKKHLKQMGIPQKELAGRVGTSQSRISEYIRGAVIPTLGVAARICKELQIDPGVFINTCSHL